MPKRAEPISALEAGRRHGIPKRTIIAAITRGDLKAQKLPGPQGAYVISSADLDRYVTARNARKASA